MRYITGAALLAILCLAPWQAAASPITIAWDASTSGSAIGYVVHVGTSSGTYTQAVDVGNQLSYVFPDAVDGQIYYFAVNAYADGPVQGPLSIEVAGYSNAPPELTNPGNQSNSVGEQVTLQLDARDPDGRPLTFAASSLPAGLSIMTSTGLINGTPTTAGTSMVTAIASDGVLSDSTTFSWAIGTGTSGDTIAPTVAITSPTGSSTFSTRRPRVTLGGAAQDNVGVVTIQWNTDTGQSGTAAGTTTWSADVPLEQGTNVVTVTARDAAGNIGTATLTITRGKS